MESLKSDSSTPALISWQGSLNESPLDQDLARRVRISVCLHQYQVYKLSEFYITPSQTQYFWVIEMPKFIPRQRKHKVLQRRKAAIGGDDVYSTDANAVEFAPRASLEREKKKANMKAALKSQQPVISAKKRKRLDKYIVRTLAV